MNIYLVRHGETEENIKRTYYGAIDCKLTHKGEEQGNLLGKKLKSMKFQRVFCSEKQRAKDTLEYIYNGRDLFIDKRLNERDFGDFEGKTFNELQEAYKEEYEMWTRDWKLHNPPKGESFIEFYERVVSFMKELESQEKECENILIATHGGVIRAMYCYILDGNLDNYWRFSSRNGDLSIIKLEHGYFYIDSIIPLEI